MLLGSTYQDEKARLVIYKSLDLETWEHVSTKLDDIGLGWMWECPDYFEVQEKGAIIFSPMGIESYKGTTGNYAVCKKAYFDETTGKLELDAKKQFLDYGLDLYAPQTTVDEKGRRVLAAWVRMPQLPGEEWNGMFCIPRLVELKDNYFYFRVHPNVEKMFRKKIDSPKEAAEEGYKISCSLQEGQEINVGGYKIYRTNHCLYTDRSAVFTEKENTLFYTPGLKNGCNIDVYVDEHLIEVYVNQGEYVITNAVWGG